MYLHTCGCFGEFKKWAMWFKHFGIENKKKLFGIILRLDFRNHAWSVLITLEEGICDWILENHPYGRAWNN